MKNHDKVWKAHFHLTISDVSSQQLMEAAKLIGAKCTTIDLVKDSFSQRDRMLTKYQKGIDKSLMLECVSKLKDAGFNVVRYKLERMYRDIDDIRHISPSKENYGEVHLKTSSSDPEIDTGFFRLSSNVDNLDYRFYNARLYTEEDKVKFGAAYNILLQKGVTVLGYHIEQVVIDSNLNLDSWWA